MKEYIYVIAQKRGGGDAEIYSVWNNYEGAIKGYYDVNVSERKEYNNNNGPSISSWVFMYELPANTDFRTKDGWSDTKIQKSSQYRMKFKDFYELEDLYKQIIRGDKLERILNDNSEL